MTEFQFNLIAGAAASAAGLLFLIAIRIQQAVGVLNEIRDLLKQKDGKAG
jgi:hypothetical protein